MAQTPSRGNTAIPKENQSTPEDEAAQRPQEKSTSGQGTIAIVKSKIREKDVSRPDEDPLESGKVTQKYESQSKHKHMKRGSSEENVTDGTVTPKKSSIKPEMTEVVKSEETEIRRESESKTDVQEQPLLEAKSRKSLAQMKASRKSLGPKEEDQTEALLPENQETKSTSEDANSAANAPVITPPPELQEQKVEKLEKPEKSEKYERHEKPEKLEKSERTEKPEKPEKPEPTMKVIQANYIENTLRKSHPKNYPLPRHIERKNYLANVTPEPLDEYPTDEDQAPKENKSQEPKEKKNDSES